MRSFKFKQYTLAIIVSASLFTVFIYGIGIGRYEWFPFQLISDIKKELYKSEIEIEEHEQVFIDVDNELLRFAFDSKIIEDELLYEPNSSLEEITAKNDAIFFPINEFYNTYDKIEITSKEQLLLDNGKIVVQKLKYDLNDTTYKTYAYKKNFSDNNSTAVLVIPGSGLNQSSKIYFNDTENYHYGLIDLLKHKDFNIYVYIKPNQDIRAWHDGNQKLSEDFIVNYHLNQHGSYSASYIIESVAFTKFLQTNYNNVILAGLSQGGLAVLLNSLMSEPDFSIISSGYSVTFDLFEWSSHNQIIIPGIFNYYESDKILSIIENQDTEYFFSYGREEIGIYNIEASEHTTCKELEPLENITCIIHEGGHLFPQKDIEYFLINNLEL